MINYISSTNKFYAEYSLSEEVEFELQQVIKDITLYPSQQLIHEEGVYQIKNTPLIKRFIKSKIQLINEETKYGEYISLKIINQIANNINVIELFCEDILINKDADKVFKYDDLGVYSWVIFHKPQTPNKIFIFPSSFNQGIFPFYRNSKERNIITGNVKFALK